MPVTRWRTPANYSVGAINDFTWTSVANVRYFDTADADATGTGDSDVILLRDFGFTAYDLPSTATIDGIEVWYHRYKADNADATHYAQIYADSAAQGSAKTITTPTAVYQYGEVLGGSSDMWGWTGASYDDITADANFGILLQAVHASSDTSHLSGLAVRVHYTDSVSHTPGGTAPSIGSSASTRQTTAATSISVTMPSGITSGDTLLMFVGNDKGISTPATVTPSGWTEVIGLTSSRAGAQGVVFRREADGTEGSSVTVTFSTSVISAAYAFRMDDVRTVRPIEGGSFSDPQNFESAHDVAGLTADYDDTLMMAFVAFDGSDGTTSSSSTGWTDFDTGLRSPDSSGATGVALHVAYKEVDESVASGDPDITFQVSDGAVCFMVGVTAAAAAGALTFGGAVGSTTATGVTADFLASRLFSATAGSIVATGVAASFLTTDLFGGAVGAITAGGVDADFRRSLMMEAPVGAVVATGVNADFLASYTMGGGVGNITATGVNADFLRTLKLDAITGSITATGVTASFLSADVFGGAVGSVVATSVGADFLRTLKFNAVTGSAVATGVTASFLTTDSFGGAVGSTVATGVAADFSRNLKYNGATGSIVATGVTASFLSGDTFGGQVGSATATGVSADFLAARLFSGTAGSIVASGVDGDFNLHFTSALPAGAVTVSGIDGDFGIIYLLGATTGAIVATGADASFSVTINVSLPTGAIVATGANATFTPNRFIQGPVGSIVATGSDSEFIRDYDGTGFVQYVIIYPQGALS